ncbi:hypothetical protein WICMUC_002063 [Wickerhamomyces mucosus]|uniref:VPS4-associated protein 1 n=1 Tax=Wickerhamomyces mucosus TaxID=1378264 RepID=A0A9P8PQX2_9ASCO|nr:hypothetical protein WICMUC_002063 [Wickerhamomyces mucosus]
MASESFSNIYHLRTVSDSNAKACTFCYKPTCHVLITSDGTSDFFYTCEIHLKDPTLCSPIQDKEYIDALSAKKSLSDEIQFLKTRWEEKHRYGNWNKLMGFASWGTTGKPDDKSTKKGEKKEENDLEREEHDSKLKELNRKSESFEEILKKKPRKYQLNKDIYKMRLSKKKSIRKSSTSGQSSTTSNITNKNVKIVSDYTTIKDESIFPTAPTNAIK